LALRKGMKANKLVHPPGKNKFPPNRSEDFPELTRIPRKRVVPIPKKKEHSHSKPEASTTMHSKRVAKKVGVPKTEVSKAILPKPKPPKPVYKKIGTWKVIRPKPAAPKAVIPTRSTGSPPSKVILPKSVTSQEITPKSGALKVIPQKNVAPKLIAPIPCATSSISKFTLPKRVTPKAEAMKVAPQKHVASKVNARKLGDTSSGPRLTLQRPHNKSSETSSAMKLTLQKPENLRAVAPNMEISEVNLPKPMMSKVVEPKPTATHRGMEGISEKSITPLPVTPGTKISEVNPPKLVTLKDVDLKPPATSSNVGTIPEKPMTPHAIHQNMEASKVTLSKPIAPIDDATKPPSISSINIERYPPRFNQPFRRQNKRSRWAERRLKWLRQAKPCGLCGETSKYRCPKCHSFHYCSVKCWKDHVKECKEMKRQKLESTYSMTLPNLDHDWANGKQVSRHQLYLLERSNQVRQSMTPEIKDIALEVALAEKPVKILEKFLETNSRFSRFAEVLLEVIN